MMKLELNDSELRKLLETLGKTHMIAHWRKDQKEEKELKDLLESILLQCEKQGKDSIILEIFHKYEPPK